MTHDSDASPETDPVAGIVAWFDDHGYELELYRGRDGSHRAAYPITGKVRHFGLGQTPLAAAQQAQAMLAERLRREALIGQ